MILKKKAANRVRGSFLLFIYTEWVSYNEKEIKIVYIQNSNKYVGL